MSGDRIDRLRAVGPQDRPGSGREIPIEVLSFATLSAERRELLLRVSDLLDQIAFGTVVLVLHESAVTQIEASEKIRLEGGPDDDG
jgi:hypothetical protein